MQATLTLTQQLGVYDFTMDTLGVDGTGIYNEDHTFTKYNFQNIDKVYTDMMKWYNTTDSTIQEIYMDP